MALCSMNDSICLFEEGLTVRRFLQLVILLLFCVMQEAVIPSQAVAADDSSPLPEVVEASLLQQLKQSPVGRCNDMEVLRKRVLVLVQLSCHYGSMAQCDMLDRVVREGNHLLATSTLDGTEQAQWRSRMLDGYYRYVFVTGDTAVLCTTIAEDEKYLSQIPLKKEENSVFAWRYRLNEAWKTYHSNNRLKAKLILCQLINDLYLVTISNNNKKYSNEIIAKASHLEICARLLMSYICRANGELSICYLYLDRIPHLFDDSATLVKTALYERLCSLYASFYHQDYNFFLERLKANMTDMQPYMRKENYKHYLELTEKEKDEVFTSRVKLSVWLDMDNRNKHWKKIEERQQSINDLIANKQYDQLAVESRKTWRIYLDLMANNYVSYEDMKDYFRFLTKVSLPLVRNGWEDKGPIREMLAESSHLLTNFMLLQIQRAECYLWEDIKKRRFPYYPYTESNNKPYEKEAMDALMQWLDLLIDESKLVSEEAQTLKKAVLSVL